MKSYALNFVCVIQMLPSRLRSTLRRIRDELILQRSDVDSSIDEHDGSTSPRDVVVDGTHVECLKLSAPRLSPVLESTEDAESFFSFAERVAASESLVFLTRQMEQLRSYVEKLVPYGDKHSLQQFFGTTLTQAAELRRPIYRIVAVQAVDYEAVLTSLVGVSFDIDDIMTQHNPYVDSILNDLRRLSKKLNEISKTTPVGPAVSNVLWEHVIRLASRTFVEGFSCVKKCTNEGRALMQLDYQHFLTKLETMTELRPIPDREYVEVYVKAFYLPENAFEQWIHEKKGVYSPKQMAGLVSCIPHLNKRARQHFYALLEEIASG